MTDLDDHVADPMLSARLSRHLERTAGAVAVRSTPVTSIVGRARLRRRRRAVGSIATAIGSIVGVVAFSISSGERDRLVNVDEPEMSTPTVPSSGRAGAVDDMTTSSTSDPPTTQTAASDPTSSDDADELLNGGMRWARAEPAPSSLAVLDEMSAIVLDDSASITWVTRDATSASEVFVSDDGVDWTPTATSPQLVVLASARESSTIHVLGFEPGADDVTLMAATSADLGRTWTLRAVPYEHADLTADELLAASSLFHVATSGDTVVAALPSPQWIDGRSESVSTLVVATGGGPLGTIPLDAGVITDVVAAAPGFLATSRPSGAGAESTSMQLHESADGITWTRLGELPFSQGHVGKVGRRYVAISADNAPMSISSSTDGFAWTGIDLDSAVGATPGTWSVVPYSGTVGPVGVVVAVTSLPDPVRLRLSKNGITMDFDAGLNDMVFIDEASGQEIGGYRDNAYFGLVRLDDGPTLSVLDESGGIRAQFSLQEATEAISAAGPSLTSTPPAPTAVIQSFDLETWTLTPIDDLLDWPAPYVTSVGTFGDRVVIRFPDKSGEGHQIILGRVVT